MTTAKRIQRKRTKGYRLPATAVFVGRPTIWGNPFTVEEHGRERAIAFYRKRLEEMAHTDPVGYREMLEPLIGKDLACFCSLEHDCHADLLLQLVSEL